MSMLSDQSNELRVLADKLRNVHFDDRSNYAENVKMLYRAMGAMREAADTIEVFQRVLRENYGQHHEQGECHNVRGCESYAPPLDVLLRCLENDYGIRASWDGLRRVWTTESVTAELDCIEDKSRWRELFGTPERAARTLYSKVDPICRGCGLWDECIKSPEDEKCLIIDYDALLGWLKQEVKR